jgi:hypothetical protein
VQIALKRTRVQIIDGHLENEVWYQKLDQEARHQYRISGRSMLQGLSAYLSTQDDDEADAEARSIGYEYAVRARRYDLSIMDATQAFLFFRTTLLDAMLKVYEAASVESPFVWSNMFRRVTSFTDGVMLALLETYTAFERNNV